ncbi:MAG: hypothetical protein QM597_05580 [Aeromicrobium sp.]|uniref:hypothetical protein n=1 Tax=Aeromicrobium sp. TaxID=1871063 RepID=UPI0039E3ADB7
MLKIPTPAPLPDVPVPKPETVVLVVRVTWVAGKAVVTHADLSQARRLPYVLTHLDDAVVVADALANPVETTVRMPITVTRLGVRGAVAAPGAALRLGVWGAGTSGRFVRRVAPVVSRR